MNKLKELSRKNSQLQNSLKILQKKNEELSIHLSQIQGSRSFRLASFLREIYRKVNPKRLLNLTETRNVSSSFEDELSNSKSREGFSESVLKDWLVNSENFEGIIRKFCKNINSDMGIAVMVCLNQSEVKSLFGYINKTSLQQPSLNLNLLVFAPHEVLCEGGDRNLDPKLNIEIFGFKLLEKSLKNFQKSLVEYLDSFFSGYYLLNIGYCNLPSEWGHLPLFGMGRIEQKGCAELDDIKFLHFFSSLPKDNVIALGSYQFFQRDGNSYFSGGAERYYLDLNEICRKKNRQLVLFQYGDFNWLRFYENLVVLGVNNKEKGDTYDDFIKAFYLNSENASLRICSPFEMAQPSSVPTIGISHGVFWDNPASQYLDGKKFWENNRRIIRSIYNCDEVVSVDTNTANWFQTIDYSAAQSIRYIPNYVDTNIFKKNEHKKSSNIIKITYPRRLYSPRGLYLALEAADIILSRYPNTVFYFIGKGYEEDLTEIRKMQDKWPRRIECFSLPPDQMYRAYEDSDITLIPTLYSEGTSLSCLEAMSSENAVVATRVGGLPDLVLSEHNGLLIEPNAESLVNGIEKLILDVELRERLQKNARAVAFCFNKQKWENKWGCLINELLKEKESSVRPVGSREKIRVKLKNEKSEALFNNILSADRVRIILDLLKQGHFLFISTANQELRKLSFERLQFINPDDDIYFSFDKELEI